MRALLALVAACSQQIERVDGPVDVGFDRPHRVDGTWLDVEGRDRTCALRSDGGIWCWDVSERQVPTQLASFPGATAFATGGSSLRCALVATHVWCKGGAVPIGPHVDEPVEIREPVVSLTGAFGYVCARGVSERVYCWEPGRGDGLSHFPHRSGQGMEDDPMVPDLPPAQAIAIGAESGCVLADGHALFYAQRHAAERVADHARAISLGRDQRCVATDDEITCTQDLPTSVIDDKPRATTTHHAGSATALAGTERTTCAIIDHRVSCWHGTAAAHDLGLTDIIAITVGDVEACARTSSGALYCWSWTRYGRT